MSEERKPRLSGDEVREVLLSDEKQQVLDNWVSIFNEIYSYSKKSKIKLNELEFSGSLLNNTENDYYILLKVFNATISYTPEKITSLLFYSPEGEGTEGVLLEIQNIRADWKNGKVKISYDDIMPVNDEGYSIPSELDVTTQLRDAVYFHSNFDQSNSLPPRTQSDLIS